jgi:hypothetical protein
MGSHHLPPPPIQYLRYDTVTQREKALAVLQELTTDISDRYNANQLALEARRLQQELQHDFSEGSTPLPSEPPTSTNQDFQQTRLSTNFLNYQPSPELRGGTSFSLIPAKSFGSSTALRLTRRGAAPRRSSISTPNGHPPNLSTGATPAIRRNSLTASTSEEVVKTRWELEIEKGFR